MSRDSRSRSRSPVEDSDDVENSPRTRRHDKRTYDRPRTTPGKRVPSDCRVYVSNIPYEFKWQDLKDLFRSEVGNVAYVEMFNDESGRPRGSAIVDFETSEMAQKAISKMHRMELKGRKLVVKEKDEIVQSRDFMPSSPQFLFNKDMDRERTNNRFGKDHMDRRRPAFNRVVNNFPDPMTMNVPPQPINYGNTYGLSISFLESLGINGPLVSKVFVANLDYKVTEEDLREVFKVAGKVVNAEVVKNLDSKSRGFGTVEYEHPLQAVQSISMLHNQTYHDRKISVRLDRVAEKHQKDGPAAKLPPGLRSLGMGLGSNGEAITDITSGMPALPIPTGPNANLPSVNTNMGMTYNIPSTNNMPGVNMRAGVNPNMPMMGLTGMDSLALGAAATIGMGMGNMGAPNGMNLGMNPGNMNQMPNSGYNGNQGMGMNPGGANGGMFNNNNGGNNNFSTPSASADFGANNYNNSARNVVQISNLPVDYTWKNLKDLCRNYGDIRFAEIKSKGIGWVRFANDVEARRTADLLDRQRFDGRVLDACVI